MRVNMVC